MSASALAIRSLERHLRWLVCVAFMLSLLMALVGRAACAESVDIGRGVGTDTPSLALLPTLSMLEDKTGQLDLRDALASTRWQSISGEKLTPGYSASSFWLRGMLYNSGAEHVTRWLENEEANADAIDLAQRYAAWAVQTPAGRKSHAGGVLFKVPHKLDVQNLVPLDTDESRGYKVFRGKPEHLRHREGFKLTDHGTDLVGALDQAHYCIWCHAQGKDSCSRGLVDRKAGAYRVAGDVLWASASVDPDSPEAVRIAALDPDVEHHSLSLVGSADRSFAKDTRRVRGFAVYDATHRTSFSRFIGAVSLGDNVWFETSAGLFLGRSTEPLGRLTNEDFVYARLKVFF